MLFFLCVVVVVVVLFMKLVISCSASIPAVLLVLLSALALNGVSGKNEPLLTELEDYDMTVLPVACFSSPASGGIEWIDEANMEEDNGSGASLDDPTGTPGASDESCPMSCQFDFDDFFGFPAELHKYVSVKQFKFVIDCVLDECGSSTSQFEALELQGSEDVVLIDENQDVTCGPTIREYVWESGSDGSPWGLVADFESDDGFQVNFKMSVVNRAAEWDPILMVMRAGMKVTVETELEEIEAGGKAGQTVVLKGTGFIPSDIAPTAKCRFGPAPDDDDDFGVGDAPEVDAVYREDGNVECIIPALFTVDPGYFCDDRNQSRRMSVDYSADGVQWSEWDADWYHGDCEKPPPARFGTFLIVGGGFVVVILGGLLCFRARHLGEGALGLGGAGSAKHLLTKVQGGTLGATLGGTLSDPTVLMVRAVRCVPVDIGSALAPPGSSPMHLQRVAGHWTTVASAGGSGNLIRALEELVKAHVKECRGPEELFRSSSFTTYVVTASVQLIGSAWLVKAVKGPLEEMIEEAGRASRRIELDPKRASGMSTVDRSKEALPRHASAILSALTGKSPPPHLCALGAALAGPIDKKWGDSSLTQKALAGIFVNRFVSPAIASPATHGVVKSAPVDPDVSRSLVLVTKLLTSLTSDAELGAKEEFMGDVKEFRTSNLKTMEKWLKALSAAPKSLASGPALAKGDEIATAAKVLLNHFAADKSLARAVAKALANSGPPTDVLEGWNSTFGTSGGSARLPPGAALGKGSPTRGKGSPTRRKSSPRKHAGSSPTRRPSKGEKAGTSPTRKGSNGSKRRGTGGSKRKGRKGSHGSKRKGSKRDKKAGGSGGADEKDKITTGGPAGMKV